MLRRTGVATVRPFVRLTGDDVMMLERDFIRYFVMQIINETYDLWREAKRYYDRRPEPQITVSFLVDALDEMNVPVEYKFAYSNREDQYAIVKRACDALVRSGMLETSMGSVDGREVRCYERAKD